MCANGLGTNYAMPYQICIGLYLSVPVPSPSWAPQLAPQSHSSPLDLMPRQWLGKKGYIAERINTEAAYTSISRATASSRIYNSCNVGTLLVIVYKPILKVDQIEFLACFGVIRFYLYGDPVISFSRIECSLGQIGIAEAVICSCIIRFDF